MAKLSLTKTEIVEALTKFGYTANPEGLIQHIPPDYTVVDKSTVYLDISPEAVRKGDEVPDRPVRITFRRSLTGPSPRWEVTEAAELRTGVDSKHNDRTIPKISPWPPKKKPS